MNELEAMKKKKLELIEKNNALKESQSKPQRDYSNSVTRSSGVNQNSAGSNASRKNNACFSVSMNKINERSPVHEEIKEL